MAIMLTERAASEVKRIIQEQHLDAETVLRVGVTGGGCSGFSYSLGFDKAYDEKADSKSQQHGITVVVDKKRRAYLAMRMRRSIFTTGWRNAALRSRTRMP